MKGFSEFIGESRGESSRPVFDRILDSVDTPTKLSQYFEENLGEDFLEFSRESEIGGKIAREFSPRGVVAENKKYRSFMGSKSGYPYYCFVTHPNGTTALAIRSTNWTTWWIGQATLSAIDPMWAIDSLFSDL
jgi:hypothetical protein